VIYRNLIADNIYDAFSELSSILLTEGMSLANDCVRTWIYFRDIEKDYNQMVSDRRRIFSELGLNDSTHYIASTGIQCNGMQHSPPIRLDAYTVPGLTPERILYLNDFNFLCAAKDYGVTFERGTRISYDDRYDYFVSGTASVDKSGNSLYPNDIGMQLNHTLKNIEALLRSGGADMSNVKSFTVYAKNEKDFSYITNTINKDLPHVAMAILPSKICRQELLVEIEAFAMKDII